MVRLRAFSDAILLPAVAMVVCLFGCTSDLVESTLEGRLVLDLVVSETAVAQQISQGRVTLEGPTPTTVTMAPGTSRTIEGLAPGTYTVSLEGLNAGDVELFGETSGVSVTAGSNTPVSVTLNSFVPVIGSFPAQIEAGQDLSIQFSAVPGATGYTVEWADNGQFSNPQSTVVTSPAATIRPSSPGNYFIRVHARNRLGSNGRSTSAGPVDVTAPLTIQGAGTGTGTVISAPGGISCAVTAGTASGTCRTSLASGTSVTLTASPTSFHTFSGWSGACSGTSTCVVGMTQARTVTASFTAPAPFSVLTSSSPAAGGTTAGGGTYVAGTSVTVTATAATGYTFLHWTEGGNPVSTSPSYQFTITGPRDLVAVFNLEPVYQVAVSASPSNGGSVAGGGSFIRNSTVTVTATPASGYSFVRWTESGSQVSTNPSYQFTITTSRNLVAVFSANPVALSWRAVSAGWSHTCGLTAQGGAYCWGLNTYGQLGNGSFTASTKPIRVSGNHVFLSISAGGYHTCGIEAQQRAILCWGYNFDGELGNGSTVASPVPVPVTGPGATAAVSWSSVSAGAKQTCGITGETAFCWGANQWGELGTGSRDAVDAWRPHPVPEPVAGGHRFLEVSTGFIHTCAVTTNQVAWCWGANVTGTLGDGRFGNDLYSAAPVQVAGGHTFVAITTGLGHSCGLDSVGRGFCWGQTGGGVLGNGYFYGLPPGVETFVFPTPQPLAGGLLIGNIAAGPSFSCAVSRSDQRVYCWGQSAGGVLGGASTQACGSYGSCAVSPSPVSGAWSAEKITANGFGEGHACATTRDGYIYCWGRNGDGQLGNGTTVGGSVPSRVIDP